MVRVSPGSWYQQVAGRGSDPPDGGRHGDRLPAVLDSIRRYGDACLVRTARSGAACSRFDSRPAGEDQHRSQSGHMCAAQQPGKRAQVCLL